MISVTLLRSCAIQLSRTVSKPVIPSVFANSLNSSVSTSKLFFSRLLNTMRPQVYLTRSDFPTAGIDLLQNE